MEAPRGGKGQDWWKCRSEDVLGPAPPPPHPPGCQMEESQCVLKYSCTLSYSPFLMCTSVPAGPGLCMSIHFISNYSPSSGRTQVTPSWTELYLDKLPSWKLSTSVSHTPFNKWALSNNSNVQSFKRATKYCWWSSWLNKSSFYLVYFKNKLKVSLKVPF